MVAESKVKTLKWDGKALSLIDQRKLPLVREYVICDSYEKIYFAIKDMIVRGAPAIGIFAAFALAVSSLSQKGVPVSGLTHTHLRRDAETAEAASGAGRPEALYSGRFMVFSVSGQSRPWENLILSLVTVQLPFVGQFLTIED